MALRTRRAARVGLALVALTAALAYLRDPPWLINITSGFSAWEQDADGTAYRWTLGRASFFVPAGDGKVLLRLRSLKETPSDWPISVTLSIDDRDADVVRLGDEAWHTVVLRLPPPGRRRVRRIDLKLDRVRTGNRGIQVALPDRR